MPKGKIPIVCYCTCTCKCLTNHNIRSIIPRGSERGERARGERGAGMMSGLGHKAVLHRLTEANICSVVRAVAINIASGVTRRIIFQ